MKGIKVLHLGRFYPPTGGLEAHVIALLEGLNPTIQADNLVASHKFSGFAETQYIHKGLFRIFQVPAFGKFAATAMAPTFPFRLRKLARKYDIIHVHLPDPLSVISVLFLPRKYPVIATWHSDVIKQRFLLKLYQPFLNRFMKRLKYLIAPTPAHFSSSTQIHLPDAKKVVIPFGVKKADFILNPMRRDVLEEIKKSNENKFLIFSLGRHVYYKGFEYLIKAMNLLPENVRLLIGGSGPLTVEYEKLLKQLDLSDRVHLPGRISEDERIAYLHACDVFCMPSIEKSEAFGLVQLDAMACGKPVICCELNNGVSYVNQHGKTGLVVPPRDESALAEAIETLMGEPVLRKAFGKYAKNRVYKEFDSNSMIHQTGELYTILFKGELLEYHD